MGTLLDQVYGCLVGGAIGDALGAAVENWHYADIRGEHGKVTDFLPQSARSRDGQPGQITDDSTLRQYLIANAAVCIQRQRDLDGKAPLGV
jgi:ADP-ribosylglycohydrolase